MCKVTTMRHCLCRECVCSWNGFHLGNHMGWYSCWLLFYTELPRHFWWVLFSISFIYAQYNWNITTITQKRISQCITKYCHLYFLRTFANTGNAKQLTLYSAGYAIRQCEENGVWSQLVDTSCCTNSVFEAITNKVYKIINAEMMLEYVTINVM